MILFFRQRQRRPDRAVYVPRGRRSQTTPRTSTSTPHSGSVPKAPVLHKESANIIAESNSIISSSQSGETIETNPQIPEVNSKEAIVEEPSIDCKGNVTQQQLNCHSQSSPKVDSIEAMADADHINANGSKIETTLNSCDKDYNEEKEFQRASKVFIRKNLNFSNRFIHFYNFFSMQITGNKSSQSAYHQANI